MRWLIVALLLVGFVFVGVLVFWPQQPASGTPPAGYSPEMPAWLAAILPDPPAARPRAAPPTTLAAGRQWSGRFFAADGKLGTARFRLIAGAELKVVARAPGEDEQVLCVTATGIAPGCEHAGRNGRGSITVGRRDADVILEATQGDVAFSIND
ncbi:hypothetical protein [Aureimonas leprariae]|uniref:Uncharacterized protein n=1 Tax=Plantimonas leprariae TaxID=2615207 RepID=A0A7V7PRJ7_9HYPH|nr:hypothetical protein [Aureimonas leprariae]KAB0681342.1 hypothetical protein F6X38_05505 [Aureimonas leprariae]